MRQNIKDFTALVAECLPIKEPIYEFGSFQVPEQVGWADLRTYFPGKKYVGADMREGPGVDKVLNLHTIELADNTAGTILCFDTLEHVEYPHRALEEMHRVLKVGGICVIASVMLFPIHEYPYDYWRFTPEAFKSILKPFKQTWVDFAGNPAFPHTIVGLGIKNRSNDIQLFAQAVSKWKASQSK